MTSDGELHRAPPTPRQIRTLDFDRVKVISAVGRGAKGVVFLVREEEEDEPMALKVVLRESIEKKKKKKKEESNGGGDEHKRVCFERKVLSRLDHPLLPRLRGVLETDKVVGYAIDYCPGRDLNHLRTKQTERMFSEEIIRFYAAELVLALEYLHEQGIVYRDLKPENVMIQENGHIMLVDFDLSTNLPPRTPRYTPTPSPAAKRTPVKKKRVFPFHRRSSSGISPEYSVPRASVVESDSEKSNSFVGTEEYVAPEVIYGHGHDFAVDWWSLGVVLYEMLYGRTPFKGSNRKETFYRILSKPPDLVGETTSLRDLIAKLLEKDPYRRITVEEIKGHDFFKGVDWKMVLRVPRPPYIPSIENDSGEGTEGMKKSEVENFVEEIFARGGKDDDDDKGIDATTNKNIDNGEWVKGLNNHPQETNVFWVF